MLFSVICRCGKRVVGSEAMAGEPAQCSCCGQMLVFPGGGEPPAEDALPSSGASPEACASSAQSQAPAPRPARDYLYWVLLAALFPLLTTLFGKDEESFVDRLARTVSEHPELRARVEKLLQDPDATLDELLVTLPGQRLDDNALLPRKARTQWWYATLSVVLFLLLVRWLFAREPTRIWTLLLTAFFTSTVGIGFLFLMEGVFEPPFRRALEPDRSFFINLLGYTWGVGLCEELCKALPILWYVRRRATWQGACLWGMASGVGFGVAEGISYSSVLYNGISGADAYVSRFVSCVALHAVWSASVGITIFQCRRLVRGALGTLFHDGVFQWQELVLPLLRVLGVAMVLHGSYDALLNKNYVAPALLVALCSFAWMGWQIETCREREDRRLAAPATSDKVSVPA
jgi:RsiW-degrading membrane proteinase PrsW (M82 family)